MMSPSALNASAIRPADFIISDEVDMNVYSQPKLADDPNEPELPEFPVKKNRHDDCIKYWNVGRPGT